MQETLDSVPSTIKQSRLMSKKYITLLDLERGGLLAKVGLDRSQCQ